MACICKNGWTNTACTDHGIQSSADDPITPSEQRDIDNAWGEPR